MADSRFFHTAGAVTLGEIAALTGAAVTSPSGNPPDINRAFTNVAPLDRAGNSEVSFLDNIKYADAFAESGAGACFVRQQYTAHAPAGMVLLITEEPYYCYALTARRFYPEPTFEPGISPQASIAKSARVGNGARIDAGVVIGENAHIGDDCWIGANTIIDDGVEIGDHCRIGGLTSISHAVIGQHAIIHRGVHIGQDGFGFAANHKGIVKVPQLGRVIIGDDVEIGAGTCIDRGAGPDTVIGSGCKIDNLVQIGHNVQLGKRVIITGQCGIAGSTHVGDGVMLGAQTGIAGHLHIGAGAKLAARSGVMRDVPPGETYSGAPAIPIKEWYRQTAAILKLGKKEA